MIKNETASTLRKKGIFYTTFSTDVIRSFDHGDAFLIWAYLLTNDDGFKIRANFLMNRYGMGKDRYRNAMRYLKEKRLLRMVVVRDDKGRFVDNETEVHAIPYSDDLIDDFSPESENQPFGKIKDLTKEPKGGFSAIRTTATGGETAPLSKYQDTSLSNNQYSLSSKPVKESKKGSRLANDWVLPLEWIEWAKTQLGEVSSEDIKAIGDQFADYWHAKAGSGATKLDWFATWRNWIRNESKKPFFSTKKEQKNTQQAYEEAVKQSRIRYEGCNDVWSSPAIYYAAKRLGGDLQKFPWQEIKSRWAEALDWAITGLKEGRLGESIPPYEKTRQTQPTPQEMASKAEANTPRSEKERKVPDFFTKEFEKMNGGKRKK